MLYMWYVSTPCEAVVNKMSLDFITDELKNFKKIKKSLFPKE